MQPTSSAQSAPDPSAKLEHFPPEVRDAYARFRDTGDLAALQAVVLAAVRDHMPKPTDQPLSDELRLMEDLGYDSLAVAETVFFIEDLFQVRVETAEIMEVKTVGALKEFVAKKIAALKAAAPGAPDPAA
ncbi:MAG: acyl carrier protein [Opitutaceae bacterium]|jgi:acyl carrier protein|nr:acyl carrier protein [Opitutaceae bacterium]